MSPSPVTPGSDGRSIGLRVHQAMPWSSPWLPTPPHSVPVVRSISIAVIGPAVRDWNSRVSPRETRSQRTYCGTSSPSIMRPGLLA